MDPRTSLPELQDRAEEIDLEMQKIADALYERGLPDADRVCSDAQCALNAQEGGNG